MRKALLALIVALGAASGTAQAQDVTCADGTTSAAGRGACSHHGGIAKTRAPRRKLDTHARKTGTVKVDTKVEGVRCNDGTWSEASGRGACSRHGGIAGLDLPKPDQVIKHERREREDDVRARHTEADTRTRTPAPRRDRSWWGDERRDDEPLARCRDGTLSYAKHHRGACSNHGGVRDWLDD